MLIQDNIQGHESELKEKKGNGHGALFSYQGSIKFMFSERKDLTS